MPDVRSKKPIQRKKGLSKKKPARKKAAAKKATKKKPPTKKVTKKRSGKKRPAKKRPAKKRPAKKRPAKKRPRRREPRSRRPRRPRPPRHSRWDERRLCLRRILGLAHRHAAWVRNHEPAEPVTFADGITSVNTGQVCTGQTIVIRGSGFGATQPANISLLLHAEDGCREVDVQPANWSDTEIRVAAPDWARAGCIGFLDKDAQDQHRAFGERLRAHGSAMARTLSSCGVRRSPSTPRAVGDRTPCAPCTGSNYLRVGMPVIRSFRLNARTEALALPTENLRLTWEVENADTFRIRRIGAGGPALDVTDPAGASLDLGPSGAAFLAEHRYRLSASNACGAVQAEVIVKVAVEPKIRITGVEITQGIQHFNRTGAADNSVECAAGKNTVVRLYVETDIAGFNNDQIPEAIGELQIMPAGRGYWDPYIAASNNPVVVRPPGTTDRADESHTFNFLIPASRVSGTLHFAFRVTVPDFGGRSGGASRNDPGDSKAFSNIKTLEVVCVRYTWNGNTPSLADVQGEVLTIRPLMPVADIDFWVPQPEDRVVTTPYNLGTDDGIFDAFDDLEDLADEYEDNGEYWVAMSVDFNRGVAWDRRQICYVGNRIKTSHELGHAHKLNHVDIGGAAEPYDDHADGAKVLDVPFDSAAMDVPADPNSGAGINDLMGYGSRRWISHITWIRILAKRQ